VGDRSGEARTLNNIGGVYDTLGEKQKALEYYNQSLPLSRAVGDRSGEATTLNNIGRVYDDLGEKQKALEYYNQALPLWRAVGDRSGEAKTLSNIGLLLNKQRPDVAIVFYKQSVNLFESLRQDIRKLPRETQEAYTKSVAKTYRALASLLIDRGRLPEAQAVLELLKLRELRDFTRDAGINSSGISLAKIEEAALNQILKQFKTLGNFAQALADCEQKGCPKSTQDQLEQQRDQLFAAVNTELDQQRAILAKHFATEPTTLLSDKLNAEARDIVNAQPGTVLIYPLILNDKIQFLLALKTGAGAVTFRPFENKEVNANQLFNMIQAFRNQLKEPGDLKQLQTTSRELYKALIQPLEPELNNPQIKHLVFAPDSITRYIPLAALYDGNHYLIERYSISTITAASTTDTSETTPRPSANQALLLATGASTFPNLPSLENVPAELDAITQTKQRQDHPGIYPGTELLNEAFDYDALKTNLRDNLKGGTYRILHIATHAAFRPGRPEDSYLVPGHGDNLTTERIDALGNYGLRKIHLVVLSACETAVGDRASDGIEIPGISYFFLKNKVKAVMASLWSVNDGSTALIMQQFYKHIAAGMTKAEALKQVQQDLIQHKLTSKNAPFTRASARPLVPGHSALGDFSHPYYWAPFILIGNSL
jgi:CHAT domain-containing protein